MTTEPRQEAWGVVEWLRNADPHSGDRAIRLVDALAAAIEVSDYLDSLVLESDRIELEGDNAEQDWTRPLIDGPVRTWNGRLADALSALREEQTHA